eukprot:15342897-Alexandrium_andersonii.AAC.1
MGMRTGSRAHRWLHRGGASTGQGGPSALFGLNLHPPGSHCRVHTAAACVARLGRAVDGCRRP